MNNYQIGFSDEFSYNNQVVKYEITTDKRMKVYVKDCAIALGRCRVQVKNGEEYHSFRWQMIYDDLVKCGIIDGSVFHHDIGEKKITYKKIVENMTIYENELYKWAISINTENSMQFKNWLTDTVLPNLREYGIYITGMEDMTPQEIKIAADERVEAYVFRKYGIGIRRRLTDTIKNVLQPDPGESYIYANYTNIIYKVIFDLDYKNYMKSIGLNAKSDSLRDYLKDNNDSNTLDLISKAEECASNFIMSGITDYNMLKSMLSNWYENHSKFTSKLMIKN